MSCCALLHANILFNISLCQEFDFLISWYIFLDIMKCITWYHNYLFIKSSIRYCFMSPAWKSAGPGASSNWIVRLSIRLSVCPFVCLSVRNSVPLTNKVQYLKFGLWYSNQTWTVSSSMGSSHFTDLTCPWGWGGVKM